LTKAKRETKMVRVRTGGVMTTTITMRVPETVLRPNYLRIRELRAERGWSLDDAFVKARNAGLSISRGTLRTLEREEDAQGCRLSTLSDLLALYELPRAALLDLVIGEPDPVEVAAPPRRRPRSK